MRLIECQLLNSDEWVMINLDNVSILKMVKGGTRLFFGSSNPDHAVDVVGSPSDLLRNQT